MNQSNQNQNFNQLQTTLLGYIGEEIIIKEFVYNKNYIPYITLNNNQSHPIDVVCMSGSSIWFLDIKTKPRRKYYPDTGIDYADYINYSNLPHPTYLLFIDSVQETIYGNWMNKLDTNIQGDIVYFPLSQMQHYRNITEQEVSRLKEYENQKKYWN